MLAWAAGGLCQGSEHRRCASGPVRLGWAASTSPHLTLPHPAALSLCTALPYRLALPHHIPSLFALPPSPQVHAGAGVCARREVDWAVRRGHHRGHHGGAAQGAGDCRLRHVVGGGWRAGLPQTPPSEPLFHASLPLLTSSNSLSSNSVLCRSWSGCSRARLPPTAARRASSSTRWSRRRSACTRRCPSASPAGAGGRGGQGGREGCLEFAHEDAGWAGWLAAVPAGCVKRQPLRQAQYTHQPQLQSAFALHLRVIPRSPHLLRPPCSLRRPTQRTPIRNFYLAGDYTKQVRGTEHCLA